MIFRIQNLDMNHHWDCSQVVHAMKLMHTHMFEVCPSDAVPLSLSPNRHLHSYRIWLWMLWSSLRN